MSTPRIPRRRDRKKVAAPARHDLGFDPSPLFEYLASRPRFLEVRDEGFAFVWASCREAKPDDYLSDEDFDDGTAFEEDGRVIVREWFFEKFLRYGMSLLVGETPEELRELALAVAKADPGAAAAMRGDETPLAVTWRGILAVSRVVTFGARGRFDVNETLDGKLAPKARPWPSGPARLDADSPVFVYAAGLSDDFRVTDPERWGFLGVEAHVEADGTRIPCRPFVETTEENLRRRIAEERRHGEYPAAWPESEGYRPLAIPWRGLIGMFSEFMVEGLPCFFDALQVITGGRVETFTGSPESVLQAADARVEALKDDPEEARLRQLGKRRPNP